MNDRPNGRTTLTNITMGKIIAVSIFKGGAGKTTTSVSIAAALAQLGAKVLLADLDQQASATRHLGLDPEQENPNLFHVFKGMVPASTAIKELPFGFDILTGHSLLAAIEEALEEGDETLLREKFAGLKHDYDYIILDSPPGKAQLAFNAMSAADEIIIPLSAERPVLDGVEDLIRFIKDIVWENYNPGLKIRGILPTRYKRTTTHAPGVVNKAREMWGDKVFPVEIPETIEFPRAYNSGVPLTVSHPDHEGARAYLAVARLIHPQVEPSPSDNHVHHEGN